LKLANYVIKTITIVYLKYALKLALIMNTQEPTAIAINAGMNMEGNA